MKHIAIGRIFGEEYGHDPSGEDPRWRQEVFNAQPKLTEEQIAWLWRSGVSYGSDSFIRQSDRVVFFAEGGRPTKDGNAASFFFVDELKDEGDLAFQQAAVPLLDEDHLFAWQPRHGLLAPWLGQPWCMGLQPFSWISDGIVTIHQSPLEWLRASRSGIVILDWQRARWELAELPLQASSPEFARELRNRLKLPEPKIRVSVDTALTTGVAA